MIIEPGQLWLMDKSNPYSGGYDGEMVYLVKSQEPDEPWVCVVFQEWDMGGYTRELNDEEINTMKYIGQIRDLKI
jgi:hypothetical protein